MRIEGPGMSEVLYPARQATGNAELKVVEAPIGKSEEIPAAGKSVDDAQVHEMVGKSVEVLNKALKVANHHLEFRMHEASGRYSVKVVDSETNQVIREIPPERMLDFSAKIKQMLEDALGLLVDEKV